MGIDPKAEVAARQMLGHAILSDAEALASAIRAAPGATVAGVIDLCVLAAGYVAVEACGHWPGQADLRALAHRGAQSVTRQDASEEEIFEFLARVTFGDGTARETASDEDAASVPLHAVASLLLAFCPQGMEWPEYLDRIWTAYKAAEMIDESVLPALTFQARRAASG